MERTMLNQHFVIFTGKSILQKFFRCRGEVSLFYKLLSAKEKICFNKLTPTAQHFRTKKLFWNRVLNPMMNIYTTGQADISYKRRGISRHIYWQRKLRNCKTFNELRKRLPDSVRLQLAKDATSILSVSDLENLPIPIRIITEYGVGNRRADLIIVAVHQAKIWISVIEIKSKSLTERNSRFKSGILDVYKDTITSLSGCYYNRDHNQPKISEDNSFAVLEREIAKCHFIQVKDTFRNAEASIIKELKSSKEKTTLPVSLFMNSYLFIIQRRTDQTCLTNNRIQYALIPVLKSIYDQRDELRFDPKHKKIATQLYTALGQCIIEAGSVIKTKCHHQI